MTSSPLASIGPIGSLPFPWLRRGRGPMVAAGLTGAVFAGLWLWYVFGGAQVAFLLATALAAIVVYRLSVQGSALGPALLLAQIAVLGTEASGALASGRAPLGSLHLLDCTVLAGAAGQARHLWALRRRVRRPSQIHLALLSIVVYALVMWAINGSRFDEITRADVRLVGLATLAWVWIRGARRPTPRELLVALAVVSAAAAAKALAIFAAEYWAIGTFDRLQASSLFSDGEVRVILVGGDSLFIIAPACAVAILAVVPAARRRLLLLTTAIASVGGLLASGTRTSLLVAVAVCVLAAGLARLRPTRATLVVVATIGALLVTGTIVTGTAQRLIQKDAPGTGLDFRRQEIDSFFTLPAADIALGQGFGGRFVGTSPVGVPVATGWSHAFPVWILLKTGAVGALAGIGLLGLGVREARRRWRSVGESARARLGAGVVAIVGLLVMSLTLGRVMLPEGALLLVLAGWLATSAEPAT